MRYRDFKIVEALGDEEPAANMAGLDVQPIVSGELEKLQTDIAARVQKTEDPALLHRIESLLRNS